MKLKNDIDERNKSIVVFKHLKSINELGRTENFNSYHFSLTILCVKQPNTSKSSRIALHQEQKTVLFNRVTPA